MKTRDNGGPIAATDARRNARMAASEAQARFWRGLDEIEGAAQKAPEAAAMPFSLVRRDVLKLMGASLALAGTAGCSRTPLEKIVPYQAGPSELTYGKPVFYASTIARDGYGCGVLVETNMGRPTKIEGNPLHPASLGATDAITQGAVLELWDPDRSQTVLRQRSIATWEHFVTDFNARLAQTTDGRGVHVLTETVTSPTLHDQLRKLLAKFPRARWHQYQPINRDNVYAGSEIAFGDVYEPRYRFDQAGVIVALDADIVGALPGALRYARDLTWKRRLDNARGMSRVYAAEGSPSLTGAVADHRHVVRTSEIAALARSLAARLGVAGLRDGAVNIVDPWLDAVVADLADAHGASIVVAGDRQPASVHALAHTINDALGNIGRTVLLGAPVAFDGTSQVASLRALVGAMAAGDVASLVMLGGNPIYNAPSDFGFAQALGRVPWSAHLSLHVDETSAQCTWHVPAAHSLECWGDLHAFDGSVAIQQPCIAPLYAGRSAHEVLSIALDGVPRSGYDVVRAYWQAQHPLDFEGFWRDALWRGVIEATPPASMTLHANAAAAAAHYSAASDDGIELVLAPDPTVGDGRYANVAWLQELPKPLTTLTWGNAALVSPALAQRMRLENEDLVELRAGPSAIRVPVWIMPGHADRSVTLYLGGGRERAGTVGAGVGANAYALRTSDSPWMVAQVAIAPTGKRRALAPAQPHHRMEGRDIVRTVDRQQALSCTQSSCTPAHDQEPTQSLYPGFEYDGYKWGMSIDLSSCIGCAACTIACQAENNIPVVGKDEVRNGREMHWIRVDRYYEGGRDAPRTLFQPVPCMQCEHAPCEEVCPVEASVHDAEGLNVQVYNRCVGTRFCSNNCPYKVRRFNFLAYSRSSPSLDPQKNPEVTVRMRGVMEKCSYCVQRIANARSTADRERRRIVDGEVVTACQAVCPTRAIVFGDLNDPKSEVNARKRSPFDYALLAELNTRPRTTYLPRLRNRVPGMEPT